MGSEFSCYSQWQALVERYARKKPSTAKLIPIHRIKQKCPCGSGDKATSCLCTAFTTEVHDA